MKVEQIYQITNEIITEVLGKEDLVQEDLSNIVDVGEEVFNADAVDRYVNKLMNVIGRMIFVDRVYRVSVPQILRDGWEYGSVLAKVSMNMPEAEENESWELQNGAVYDTQQFYQPQVSVKFYNKKVTFEVPMSYTRLQVKQSFHNAIELNSFISMIYGQVERAMTVRLDQLIMRVINSMIGDTIYSDYGTDALSSKTGVRAINLLYLYNQKFNSTLTASDALTTPEFIRFASYQMGLYADRLSRLSTLFNVGGMERFTPREYLRVALLSEFQKAAAAYLQSDTFHDLYTALPSADSVPYWQGSGTDYSFDQTSAINVKTGSGNVVEASGILGVMFDRDACGVSNLDRRVTSTWNPKAEFFSNWEKMDAGYFTDLNENFIVFFVA